MALEITESANEEIVILKLKGRLVAGETNGVREKITQLAAAGRLNVVMDLSDVDYIDSRALGGLVSGLRSLTSQYGTLKLRVNLNKRDKDVGD